MKFSDIDSFSSNDSYFEEIFPDVWLMDDHRWAYYIWEKIFFDKKNLLPVTLIHLDCHWNGVNDFHGNPPAVEELTKIKDINNIYCLVHENANIRNDSFIAPAIIRGLINEIHFFCKETCTGPGLYPPFMKEYNARQFMYENIESLISNNISKPVIFDIDLDFFNKSEMWDEGNLMTDLEIMEFLSLCTPMIKISSLVTASMSFGYSGTEDDTRHLAKLFYSFMEDLKAGIF